MGWVEDRFQYESDLKRFIPQLWDEMRDRISVAVAEFNGHTSDAAQNHLEAKDCTSMGTYCRRVTKHFGAVSTEVFLHEKNLTLHAKSHSGALTTVCKYRIRADRTGAEFFLDGHGDSFPIGVDEACKMALESFIFGH